MSDYNIQEEIDRKALETICKLANDRDQGRITESQYSYGLDILWSAIAGMVDTDLALMMEVAKVKKEGASFFTREYYCGGKGHIAKITNTHRGIVVFDLSLYDGTHQSRKLFDFREEPNPYVAAKQKFQELGDGLVAKGFNSI